jgi:predicted AlkP superfamily pyrophosphatase or phosphodiesterase
MLTPLLLLFQASLTAPPAEEMPPPPVDHVLLISVDGLRSDVLQMEKGVELPNFRRLMDGAMTLNARCDPAYSVTLPNHTDMLTGRLVEGEAGHHWTSNAIPPDDGRLVDSAGETIASVFHRTSAAGIADALIASKDKFLLFEQTWNPVGAPPLIDRFRIEKDASVQVDLALDMLDPTKQERSFVFLHFRGPDDAGHDKGWDMTPGSLYLEAVAQVDAQLGRMLDILEADPNRHARTAIVLTADHGGGIPFKNHHGFGMLTINTTIPLLVDLPGLRPMDLYETVEARRDPGNEAMAHDPDLLPPIRNADVANLCLALFGLDPVEGSTVNRGQDLHAALRLAIPSPLGQ